jgi:hypothetical protein
MNQKAAQVLTDILPNTLLASSKIQHKSVTRTREARAFDPAAQE